ncbi:hypothetical protein WJX73_003148 [Symbiochloris irregularis]|uniref:Uncharacterized protein n=1 Tax=Symbiochloris irregularis TaxID=706552 RepID=A0AAW1P0N1_9CHLO
MPQLLALLENTAADVGPLAAERIARALLAKDDAAARLLTDTSKFVEDMGVDPSLLQTALGEWNAALKTNFTSWKPGSFQPVIAQMKNVLAATKDTSKNDSQDFPPQFRVPEPGIVEVHCAEAKAFDGGSAIPDGRRQLVERVQIWAWVLDAILVSQPKIVRKGSLYIPYAPTTYPVPDTSAGFEIKIYTGLEYQSMVI